MAFKDRFRPRVPFGDRLRSRVAFKDRYRSRVALRDRVRPGVAFRDRLRSRVAFRDRLRPRVEFRGRLRSSSFSFKAILEFWLIFQSLKRLIYKLTYVYCLLPSDFGYPERYLFLIPRVYEHLRPLIKVLFPFLYPTL